MKVVASPEVWSRYKKYAAFDEINTGLFIETTKTQPENLNQLLKTKTKTVVVQVETKKSLEKICDMVVNQDEFITGEKNFIMISPMWQVVALANKKGFDTGMSAYSQNDLTHWHINRSEMGKFLFLEKNLFRQDVLNVARVLGFKIWAKQNAAKSPITQSRLSGICDGTALTL